ncbi:amino acid ABC transporter ATP-binding protein [Saccharopolyspora pogona]|uniref:amino acid ABC transporter ATP-binding protein n=1 Tax=Saccharopolyspora pogona TaxID=333966 RepID=UPI001681CA37|nr:amino acid ABC transporter ATP-binding protein [Saccharopolyspora pogona]
MALLEVQDLTKVYGDVKVLRGVDFTIEPGQVVAVIGPSGGGKSTFLRCLNLLEAPTSGSVRFDGEELTGRGVDLDRLRSRMGMVFQHFNLFPNMTALRNVVLPQMNVLKRSKTEAEAKARDLLQRVGMLERANAYPNRLSGGQKQRVAIVRAAAMDPKLMLFDEPTSALDPEVVQDVLNIMSELADDGMTMVVVTHEMGFARKVADRVVFVDGGKIVADLPPAEFFSDRNTNPRIRAFLDKVL